MIGLNKLHGENMHNSRGIYNYVATNREWCPVRFPANHGGVRKSIRPQMLLCHTNVQVCRPALILEIIVSQGIGTINDCEFFIYMLQQMSTAKLHFIVARLNGESSHFNFKF